MIKLKIAKAAHKNGTTLKFEVIKSGLVKEKVRQNNRSFEND